jgi:hypothetical protein
MSVFHADERAAQALAGRVLGETPAIRALMPEQHRTFFAGLLYLFVGAVDETGWPIATMAAGRPGFIASPDPHHLRIADPPAPDDPAARHLVPGRPVGLLGIDLSNRRRNRANGTLVERDTDGITVRVAESFGNCPQYIQRRDSSPVLRRVGRTVPLGGLDGPAREAIAMADTLFVASRAREGLDGGADISHRGGRPGFVRVEGDTLSVPDFPGNHYYNTLGNLLGDGRASLLVPDFATGDLLILQGMAEIDWTGRESGGFAGAVRSWRVNVLRGWQRAGALPFRWSAPEPAAQTVATGHWDDVSPSSRP